MKAQIVLLALCSIALGTELYLAPQTGTVSNPSVAKQIIKKDDVLILQLKELGAAGYTWLVHEQDSDVVVKKLIQSKHEQKEKEEESQHGGASEVFFEIACGNQDLCSATSKVTFIHIKSWLYDTFKNEGLEAYKEADISEPGMFVLQLQWTN